MKFEMTSPCAKCPFRTDIPGYLTGARAQEIAEALLAHQCSFTCHKTNEVDDETGDTVETDNSQHCAGALIFLEKHERPNQIMRWMERIGFYDRTKLRMDAPVFDTAGAFIGHHRRGRRR